ncbi:sensor histidine kinase [Streptomonospora nanhaiensis]|uniref:sensor histidine kinase n=1 Tax=Streptomonospora nanhaiensis TaxID=1323731 RepID=UPI001C37FCCF|nr:histidine kinase [Streptomonospora nanhaiensis]MBV2363645.1 two-component sensor histidine kinase [Streptomonospora nanhaiensis]
MRKLGAAAARAGGELLRPLSGRPTAGSLAGDALLWAALCVPAVMPLVVAADTGGSGAITPLQAVLACTLLAAAVALGRPYPVAAGVLGVGVVAVNPAGAPALIVLSYLAGRRDPRVWPAAAALGAVALGAVVFSLGSAERLFALPGLYITIVFVIVLPWMVGVFRRQRRRLADSGWELARRLEREQEIAADQARLRERARIAQDMHDSLGHELSLIALRAGALELAPDLAEHHRAAAAGVRERATAATDRLREIVGVLREADAAAPTAPADEEIAAVVERAREAGVQVVLERRGTWEGLPPMVDRAAYRVVQEGLTNATRHAPGAPVRVLLERGPAGTVAAVRNAAPPRGAVPSRGAPGGRAGGHPAPGGHGLIGLAERVRLAGGVLEAGEDGGGFAVTARFPAKGAAPASAPAASPTSAADRHLRAEHRRLRWRTARMVLAAGALAVVGMALGVAGTFVRMDSATLDPADYRALRVGAPAEEVAAELPWQEYDSAAADDGSALARRLDCRYYRSHHGFLSGGFTVYRLCFDDGVLAAKDALPELGEPPA